MNKCHFRSSFDSTGATYFENNKRYYSGKTNNNSAATYSITEDNAGNIWAIRGTNSIWLKKKNEDRFKWLGNYTNDLRKDKSFFNILTFI